MKNETRIERAKKLSAINLPKYKPKEYETLIEMLEDLGIELCEDLKIALDIIDERYIQKESENKKHYFQLLNELKNQIEDYNF